MKRLAKAGKDALPKRAKERKSMLQENKSEIIHFGPDSLTGLPCPYSDASDRGMFASGANEARELYDECADISGEFAIAYFQLNTCPREYRPYFRGMLDSFREILGRKLS